MAQTQKSVVITGASTGIGEACAYLLAKRGWLVFAGIRKTADGDRISRNYKNILPILLDVTCHDHIRAATDYVASKTEGQGIHGLINNAGIAIGGPLEFLPLDLLRSLVEVNMFGPIAMTQAFLPLIRQARGRIVFVSSNSGFWCEPFLNVYGATKHALEAIGDSLRVELKPWGIEVVLIEPGMIKTPIWDKARLSFTHIDELLPKQAQELYAKPLEALRRMVYKTPFIAAPPERVAQTIVHALEVRCPRPRYRVGLDARIQYYLRRILPDRIRDRMGKIILGLRRD